MATKDVEFRIMPSGNGRWYREVISAKDVIARGVADTEPAACAAAITVAARPI